MPQIRHGGRQQTHGRQNSRLPTMNRVQDTGTTVEEGVQACSKEALEEEEEWSCSHYKKNCVFAVGWTTMKTTAGTGLVEAGGPGSGVAATIKNN